MDMREKIYRETRMGNIKLFTPVEHEVTADGIKEHHLTPTQKLMREKYDHYLTQKAESQSTICHHCQERYPIAWVREIQFDVMEQGATINHAVVSSGDYGGPIPGFCFACISTAPQLLAQAVYFDRPEMYWGFRPTRWHVIYTDGTKTGGPTMQIDPIQESPEIQEEFISGNET